MRNNKKKGFTLVELLVVIAILAILATVSVVGYTSFIKSAHISNDENIAAQLNQFLAAYQADHTTEHYGKPITEDNIWEITQTILKDSQLDELEPHAKDYGYHYYFKFDGQGGGEYVAADENTLRISAFTRVVRFFVSADTPKSNYAGVFYDEAGSKYFLCDTKGSPIAEAIKGFHTFKDIDGATSAEQFANFKTLVNGLNDELYGSLKTLAASGVFVTKEGNFAFDRNAEHSNLFFHENATFVGNTIKDAEDELLLGADKPLLKVTEATNIVIPNGIKLPANSLNIDADDDLVTITINANSWTNEIKDIVDAYFTNDNVIVSVGGREYKINGNYIFNKEEYNPADLSNYVDVLKFNNPLKSFDIEIKDTGDKVFNNSETKNLGNVALDGATYQFNIINTVGTKNDGSSISTLEVKWGITSITMNGNATAITDANTIKKYVEIDPNTGDITFKKDSDGLYYALDTVTVKATAVIGTNGLLACETYANQTYTVSVGRVNVVGLQCGDTADADGDFKQWFADEETGEYNITLIHRTSGVAYTIAAPHTSINNTGITLSDNVVVTSNDTEKSVIKIDGFVLTTVSEGETSFTVQVGDYLKYKVNVTVRDVSNLAIQPKHSQISFVGNANKLAISDLFVLGTGKTIPAGAELKIFHIVPGDDDYFNPTGRTPMYTELSDGSDGNPVVACAVKKNSIEIASDSNGVIIGEDIEFMGTRDDTVYLAVFHNGVRISDDIEVHVVNGSNVNTWDEMLTEAGKGNGLVLLNDIKPNDGENRYLLMSNPDTTLYGNYFTIDLTKFAIKTGNRGIINLQDANMQDTRVVGAVYPTMQIYSTQDYGANAVHAWGNSTITNCYMANCRAPLGVGDERNVDGDGKQIVATVTLNDVVLFGGRYCNLDIREGRVTLEGDIVMVNQPHNDGTVPESVGKVVGTGINIWFEAAMTDTDLSDTTVINNSDSLKQFNFIAQSDAQYLPIVTLSLPSSVTSLIGTNKVTVQLPTMFGEIFTDTSGRGGANKYASFMFEKTVGEGDDAVTTQYVDAAFLSTAVDMGVLSNLGSGIGALFGNYYTLSAKSPNFLPTDYSKTEYAFVVAGAKLNLMIKEVGIKFQLPIVALNDKNNPNTNAIFSESFTATDKYCSWDVDTNEDGTVDYVAYDFAGTSIIH